MTAITPVVNVIEKGQTTNNAEIAYTTDNERVATVVDGKIVAVDAGTTKVRGTYKESGFIINVTVDKPVFEVVATNGVVEVGRLADVAFDIRLEGVVWFRRRSATHKSESLLPTVCLRLIAKNWRRCPLQTMANT